MTGERNSPAVRIAIHGAAGRMGKRLIALASADPGLRVAAAIESPQHPDLGKDAGTAAGVDAIGTPITSSLSTIGSDVVIDFSVPASAVAICQACEQSRTPLVLATTGFTASQQESILRIADSIAMVWAPSMSPAVNLTMRLACVAAEILKRTPQGADVEIIERHHRFKHDAPSGTALRFGSLISEIMGQTRQQHGRHGMLGQRPNGEIGYHAVRAGDNPGEHTILFGMLGETIELTVRATSRDCYAHGALAAAKFLVGKPAGRYSMDDVLGLTTT